MKFGAWIRAHRLRQNLSMDRVCQSVDLSKAYLSLIETGQKGPPKDGIIRQIAAALSLDEADLLSRAHRERYPEDVLALRSVIEDMRRALKDADSPRAAVLSGAAGGRRSSSADKSQGTAESLSDTLKRLERLVPSGATGGDELSTEIDDLRAEEREFLLQMVREIKRLRPRRGPQGASIPALEAEAEAVAVAAEAETTEPAEPEAKARRARAGNGSRGHADKATVHGLRSPSAGLHASPRRAPELEWSI